MGEGRKAPLFGAFLVNLNSSLREKNLVTTLNEILAGHSGCRFVSSDTGQPARRVIATPLICTRSRGGNIERGIGVEYFSGMSNHEGIHHIFLPMESKNPKEYLRAFEILNRMERVDPDILAVCAHLGKKQITEDNDAIRCLKKYQPAQVSIILEKRRFVFEQPCDPNVLQHIIAGFQNCGMSIDDPFAKVVKKEAPSSRVIFSRMTGAEMSLAT